MIFNTYWFVCAVVPFLVLYLLIPQAKIRFCLLILFCAVFHFHFAGPAGVLPIIVLGAVTYACALSGKKGLLIAGIVFCVLALCFYKYSYFVLDEVLGSFMPTLAKAWKAGAESSLPAAPPLAISFFTFEFVHYLSEVYRGNPAIKSPFKFMSFALFFPSLVAGPIKRYQQFLPSLEDSLKTTDWSKVVSGVMLVAIGLFKKLVVADNLTLFTEAYAPRFAEISLVTRWIFLFALSIRIYLDFAGYSDIAIGLARIMGIQLPKNFDWPYLSKNIREFWQRWHMSLSFWIRDYIYIPMGGNRCGTARTIINAGFAFALCGLWHGAHWNFVVWGLYHGLGIAICLNYRKFLEPQSTFVGELFERFSLLRIALTFLYVSFGWLLFFYPLDEAVYKFVLLFSTRSL